MITTSKKTGTGTGKMKIFARWMMVAALFMITGHAQATEGLWVGSVVVDAVSEVNKPRSDLSFDLQLEGTLLEENLVAEKSTWSYDSGTDQGIIWRQAGFDDSSWSSAPGPFSYGVSQPVTTSVDFGGDSNDKYPTTYFRQEFNIVDASLYTDLLLRYRRDDGIAIYINGQLVLKENLPSSLTSYDTLALTSIDGGETDYQELTIPTSTLVDGTNLLAVEIHISSASDADMSFDLSLAGQRAAMSSILIGARANDWRYSDSGDELPVQWRDEAYAEPGWKTGAAPLGYGDGDEATVISAGPSLSEKNPVSYFRKQFNVADTNAFSHLNISLQRDDGAVVYLNGTEIMRSNLPEGQILYTSLPIEGIGAVDENNYIQKLIPSALLNDGSNVIAVEIHQHAAELTPFEGTAPPSATASSLSLRILLHEDSNGDVKLLKQVIQMWQDGTLNPDGTLKTPGHYVLLTDDTLIPNYKGVGVRDSSLVGRRISAVGFDFPGEQTALTGSMDIGQSVSGTLMLPGNLPTHPRRHQYHPQHDNLNATYNDAADEVGDIERTITLQIAGRYPPDPNKPRSTPPPDWGTARLGGVYQEVITGMHRDPIEVKGIFTLSRVSDRGMLNE